MYAKFFPVCFVLFFLVIFFPTNSLADDSVPAAAYIAYENPFYMSDYDFGIYILDYLDISKQPYLTEGLDDDSDLDEIARAYEKASADLTQQLIVQKEDRVTFFTAQITDASDLDAPNTIFTFSNFNPSDDMTSFTIGSLPNKDHENFYTEVISRYLNPGKEPYRFDALINFVSDDGSVIQSWSYIDCKMTDYSIYLKDDLGILNYIKYFGNEIRDELSIDCNGFRLDPTVRLNQIEYIPPDVPATPEDRATSIVARLVDVVYAEPGVSYSISKFEPIWFEGGGSGSHFGKYTTGFALESLPTKDKQSYYEKISHYINPGHDPVAFDVTIDVLTGDKNVLQSWIYKNCQLTNYTPYLLEFMMVYKFHPDFTSEVRDRAEFKCQGLSFDAELKPAPQEAQELAGKPITDDERAFFYVVHLVDAPDIPAPGTSFGFSSFSYFTDPTLSRNAGIKPDNPIGSDVNFFIEGLSGKDKELLYQTVSRYINPEKEPYPFDVNIDLVSRDGYTLQTWEHRDCDITDFNTYVDEIIIKYKFVRQFIIESRDTVWFSCNGYKIDTEIKEPTPEYASIPLVPLSDDDRVRSYAVHVTDAPDDFIETPKTFYTFSNFEPLKISKGGAPADFTQYRPGFIIQGHTSTDHQDFYDIVSRYTTGEKDPEPFDVNVEVLTGDAHTVQTWEYERCELDSYDIFNNRNLTILKMDYTNAPEIRDRALFLCQGMYLDPNTKEPTPQTSKNANTKPEPENRAHSYVVRITDAQDIEIPKTWYTFTEFAPTQHTFTEFQSSLEKPGFTLKSLPSKDNADFYDIVKRYTNPASDPPDPFDVKIDVVTKDGRILQTWEYEKCGIENYMTYVDDNLLDIKYIGLIKSEIKDRSIFTCDSWHLNPVTIESSQEDNTKQITSLKDQIMSGVSYDKIICRDGFSLAIKPSNESSACVKEQTLEKLISRGWISGELNQPAIVPITHGKIPTDDDRAIKYDVHITDASDIDAPKTWNTFSKFAPYSEPILVLTELSPVPMGMLPDYPFGEKPKFYLESLPSKDKEDFYEIVSRYFNPGSDPPDPFDMRIDLLTGNDEILQIWDYEDCQMVNYDLYLNEQLLTYKFHEKYSSEFQDRTLFECNGFSLNEDIDSI